MDRRRGDCSLQGLDALEAYWYIHMRLRSLTKADGNGRLMDIRNPQAFPSSGAASRVAEQRPHSSKERAYQTSWNLAKVGDAV